jgi:hypothetical protein
MNQPSVQQEVKLPLRPDQKKKVGGKSKKERIAKKISEAVSKKTPDILQKLEQAFSIDTTIEEACLYAGISPRTYHYWVSNDAELLQRFNTLRLKPILKARQEIVKGINGDKHFAMEYMRKKRPMEFGENPSATFNIERAVIMLPARVKSPKEVLTIEHIGTAEEKIHD